MFQGLNQGATVTVLRKNVPSVEEAKVLSVNTHMPSYNPGQPLAVLSGPVTDITVQVGGETIPFAGLPANGISANFPDKGIFLSTDRAAVIREVESMQQASKQALSQVEAHRKMEKACGELLDKLNPERMREAERSREMNDLRGEVAGLKQLLMATLEQMKQTQKNSM